MSRCPWFPAKLRPRAETPRALPRSACIEGSRIADASAMRGGVFAPTTTTLRCTIGTGVVQRHAQVSLSAVARKPRMATRSPGVKREQSSSGGNNNAQAAVAPGPCEPSTRGAPPAMTCSQMLLPDSRDKRDHPIRSREIQRRSQRWVSPVSSRPAGSPPLPAFGLWTPQPWSE